VGRGEDTRWVAVAGERERELGRGKGVQTRGRGGRKMGRAGVWAEQHECARSLFSISVFSHHHVCFHIISPQQTPSNSG